MCFSATASFATSAALAGMGVYSLNTAKSKRLRWFAFIPIFFSIQQAIEGFQWLAPKPSTISTVLGYGFLFFAFIFWLIAIPIIVRHIEPRLKRKKCLFFLACVGAIGALYALVFLIKNPLTVCVTNQSIDYQIFIPFVNIGIVAYVIVTCGSLLVSSRRFVNIFGILAIFSLLISFWAYRYTLTSVWCFFAAVLSLLICIWVAREKIIKNNKKNRSRI